MTNLPAIPKAGTAIALADMERMEQGITQQLALIEDVDTLLEWKAQAAALEQYLRGKDLNGPMLAAQRKVEARIGQLLGQASNGGDRRSDQFPRAATEISSSDRLRFRILARGLERGLPDEDWRRPRTRLIALIQERFPVARTITEPYTDAEGSTKKPRTERVDEIRKRAEDGMRASQIATDLGIGESQVRRIAKDEGIALPDAAIGKRARLDATRILTESINGVDAYVSGLSMLEEMEMPELPAQEAGDLLQALARSINGLRKLRTRMEKEYGGCNATAA
jgi:hypothetical protein